MGLEFNSDKQYIKSSNPKLIATDNLTIRAGDGANEREILRATLDPNVNLARIGVNRTGNRVDIIKVTAQGAGYTAAPTVNIGLPNEQEGVQATAQALLSNGRVIAILVTDNGSGYTSAPLVSFSNAPTDLTGQGAAATAFLDTIDYEFDINGAIRTSTSIISDTARIKNIDIDKVVTAGLDLRAPDLKLFGNNYGTLWTANITGTKGDIVYYEENIYKASNSGIYGQNAPLHGSGTVVNGTINLSHVGYRVSDQQQQYYGELAYPTSVTPPLGDRTSKIATTEYVLDLATNDVGGRVYVSAQIGNDENDGRSPAAPVRSIKRGCQIASATVGVKETVVIAGGDYTEDNPISIPPDCSIVGDSLRIVTVRPNNPGKHMFKLADKNYISGIVFRDKLDTAGNPTATWNFAGVFDDKQRLYYDPTTGGDFKRNFPIGHQIFGKSLGRIVFSSNTGGNRINVGETITGVNTGAIGTVKVITYTSGSSNQSGTIDYQNVSGNFAIGETVRYYIEAPAEYTGWPSDPGIGDPYTHPTDSITYFWNGQNWAQTFEFIVSAVESIRAEGEVVEHSTSTQTYPITRIDASQQSTAGGIIFYTNILQGTDNMHDLKEGQEVLIQGLTGDAAFLNGYQRIYDLDKKGVLYDDDARSRRFVLPKYSSPQFTESNFEPGNATVKSVSYYVTVSLLNSPNKFEETPYISRRYQDARTLIKNNLEFIKDEAYKQIIAEFPDFVNPNESKCRRDIGHFVTAIMRDMEYGGNFNTIEAAKSYVLGTQIGYIGTEIAETVRAFEIATTLAIHAMRGWVVDALGTQYQPQFTTIEKYYDSDVIIDTSWPRCANVTAALETLSDLFISIITNSATGRYLDAGNQIARNQQFIKQEVSRYIEDKYPELFLSPNSSAARYKDSTNLIRSNRDEILDRALAQIGVDYPDFYYPGDAQTNSQSRYNDAYRLILKNKEVIIDTAAAAIAVQYPDFYIPGDQQTNERSRFYDAYRLIQQNKADIITTAYAASGGSIPADTNGDKCKRDIGYFIDAISLDTFLGGNSNSIAFVKQYFTNGALSSNGLLGEITQSVAAFNSARNEMKKAIANQLAVKDLTLTTGPSTYGGGGGNIANTNANSCADVQSAIATLTLIITDRLNAGNLDNLPNINRDWQSRYYDAANLIKLNKTEIVDRASAEIAVQYPDFYYPGDSQTTGRSRYKDSYRLIQQNKTEIVDRAAAEIAVQYPDFYYPGDTQTNSRARFKDGYRLIQLNRTEIINTAFSAMQSAFPTFTVPGGDNAKCKRDIGFYIDAVSLDMSTGGNQYTIAFIKQYFTGAGTLLSNGLEGEITQSVYALTSASNGMRSAVTNQLTVKDTGISVGPSVYGGGGGNIPNTSSSSCSDVRSAITTLETLTTSRLSAGNINGGNALPTPTNGDGFVTTGEAKCKRDIGYFVDAISLDVFSGGNQYTIAFTKQYFNSSTGLKISNGLSGEELESDAAFTKAVEMMQKSVSNQLYVKDLTLSYGPAQYNGTGGNIVYGESGNSATCADVQTNIATLANIAQSRILAGNINNLNALPTITTGNSITATGELKCRRDIGYIVDAVVHDLQYGGNARIIDYTQRYFANASTLLSNGLAGEITQSVTAFNMARDMINKALTNQLYVKDYTLTADPETGSNISASSCANVRSAVSSLISILTSTLTAGNTSGLPAVRNGAGNLKCRRDIGYFVDAIALDIFTKTNKYTKKFIKSYFVNGSPISNGLVGETAQSIVAFNKARDMINASVSNQLYYKDLTVSVGKPYYDGPAGTVTNIDTTACSDVQSGVSTLTKIVTDIITAGSLNSLPADTNLGRNRYQDSKNLITLNRQEIIDRAAAEIAVQYPDFYYPGDTQTNATSRYKDSYRLIQQNKADIITTAYAASGGSIPGDTNGDKCKRDIGYFIDAVSLDIAQGGGNRYSRKFIQQYFTNATTPLSNGLVGEEAQSIAAFNSARDEMKKAITNQLAVKDLTITAGPATYGGGGGNIANTNTGACADVQFAIETLTTLITARITAGNLTGLAAETTGSNGSGETKCKRDIGYIVDAIAADLSTGGNSNIIFATKKYFSNATTLSTNGLLGETAQSIIAFNMARDMIKKAVTNQLYGKDLTISAGPAQFASGGATIPVLPSGNANACVDVQSSISTLIAIITTAISNGNLNSLPSETNPTNIAGESKCRRDIGYIVDAVASDLYDGGNSNIISATKRYFRSVTIPLSNGLVGETAQSIIAFNKAKDIMQLAVTNNLFERDLTITGDPNPGLLPTIYGYGTSGELNNNNDTLSCVDVRNSISTLISIATSAISNGNLNSLPSINAGDFLTTVSIKCRRDIGSILGAAKRDLILGGNAGMVTAAESYYTGNALTGIPEIELLPTREAFTKARDLCILAMRNWKTDNGNGSVYVPEFATAPQYIDSSLIFDNELSVCNNVAATLTTSFTVLDTILSSGITVTKTYGTLYTPVTVYPENVIYDTNNKYVNVDAAYLDLPFVEASPYIQNASVISFLGGGGCEIDGDKVRQPNCPRPGLKAAVGQNAPKAVYPNQGKSFVAAQFTIISFGGVGYRVVNDGYCQLVSVFVLFAQDGIYADTGGYASVTNAATNFGTYALRARGYRKDPYEFDIGTITNTTLTANGRTVFTVSGLGRKPLEHYIVKFDEFENRDSDTEYFVELTRTTSVGPPFTSTFDLNEAILIRRKDDQTPVEINNTTMVGKTIKLHRPSIVNSSGHTWEFAGSGNDYNALPENGGIKDVAKEQVSQAYGRVYTSGTDELGDFKVGYFAKIENRTGAITFTGTVSISEVEFLKLKGGDVVVTGFDKSNTLGGSFSTDSKIPTQKAVKDYISNNLGPYINKPYSTNPVPRSLVELTDSGKISLDQIPALRPFSVYTVVDQTGRLELEGALAGDIAIQTDSNASYILNNDTSSEFLAIAVDPTLIFTNGRLLTGSVTGGIGRITEYREGVVFKINITDSGSGYVSAPTISISSPEQPGGVIADASCTIADGKVVTVTINTYNGYKGGKGYTSPPSVQFSAPPVGGVTALASGLIESRVYTDIVNNIKLTTNDTIESNNTIPQTVSITRVINTSGNTNTNWVSLSTTNISADNISSGTISPARLAGNASESNSFTFLRGDQSYALATQALKAAETRYFDRLIDQTLINTNTLKFNLNPGILQGHTVIAEGIPSGTTIQTVLTIDGNQVVILSTSVTAAIPIGTPIEFIRPGSPVLLSSSYTISNFVQSVVIANGGSSYTDGTYYDISISGGSGTGLKANIIVSGGIITTCVVTSGGKNYAGDFTVSEIPAEIGPGTGAILYGKINTTVNNYANVAIDIRRADDRTLSADAFGNTGVSRFLKSQFKIGESGDGSIELKVGADSGLDADLLDGQQGNFYLDGTHFVNLSIGPDKLASGTYSINISGQSGNTLKLTTNVGSATSSPSPSTFNEGIVVDTRNNTADGLSDGGSKHGVITFRQWGVGSDASGGGVRQLAFTDNNNLWVRGSGSGVSSFSTWSKIWTSLNDGAGTGLDADVLDGRQGIFYQNGYNINTGIIGASHISQILRASTVQDKLTVKSFTSQTFYDIFVSGKILADAPFIAGTLVDIFDAVGVKLSDFEITNITTYDNADNTLDYTIITGRLIAGSITGAFKIGSTITSEFIADINISDTGTFAVASLESVSGTAKLTLGRQDGVSSSPTIDFRSSSSPAPLYNVRLVASGGNGNNGSGTLNILASNSNALTLNSNVIWNAGNVTFSDQSQPNVAVIRDNNQNFAAGTITASLTGAASLNVLKSGDTMSGNLTMTAGNGIIINTSSGALATGSGNKNLTIINDTNGRDAFLTFSVTGDYSGYFGLDGTTNDLFWGGWSVGTSTKYTILHTGNNLPSTNNDFNTLVKRDGSGNFTAGTITAELSGNATTATTLKTARTINGVSFDGSQNITITSNTANALSLGTYLSYDTGTTFNGGAARTINVSASSTYTNGTSNIVARDTSGNFTAGTITAALSGNASTATKSTNIIGGAAGGIPYQTGADATAFLAASANKFLKSTAGAPTWVDFPVAGSSGQIQYHDGGTPASLASSAQLTYSSSVLRLGNASSYRQTNVPTWTGDAGAGEGKLEYHSNRWYINAGTDSTEVARFRRGATDVAWLSNAGDFSCIGDITAFATSDGRLKINVDTLDNALNKIDSISGVTYNWNDLAVGKDQTKREVGVIAQEIQKVLPEAVIERDNGYLAVQYERLIPLLIEAIKELKQEVDTLKQK